MHQITSFPKVGTTRASQLLEIVHTDVCGPMRNTSHGATRYFLTFIDDFSMKTHVYLLKTKGEAFEKCKQYKALPENEICHKIKVLWSDNGGEFVSKEFDAFLAKCGIQWQTSAPYSPQQNGVPERANRTIMECARNMILAQGLELEFLGRSTEHNGVQNKSMSIQGSWFQDPSRSIRNNLKTSKKWNTQSSWNGHGFRV
jgi:hypothetical protein